MSLKDGRILVVQQERGNKVKLIDTVNGNEELLIESEDDNSCIFKLGDSSFSLVENGKITVFDFVGN